MAKTLIAFVAAWLWWWTSLAWSATYYVDNLVACTGTYSPSARDCSGNSGNSYTTIAAGVAPLVAGDTLYIRQFSGGAGVWNAQIDLSTPNKTGTAGSPIIIEGYPGDTVTFRYASTATQGYGTTRARGSRGYITFKNMVWDGANLGAETQGIQIRDGNHHFILDNIEILNHTASAVGINGSDNQVVNCRLHDNTTAGTNRPYGLYISGGSNNVIEHNLVYHNAGGGVHIYNGTSTAPLTNLIVRRNRIYENNTMASSNVGGIVVHGSVSALIANTKIYDNVVYRNGKWSPVGGDADGINFNEYSTNSEIYNNVVLDNKRRGIGAGATTGLSNVTIKNNISIDNDVDDYLITSVGLVASHNAATSAESAGTNKITLAAPDECLVTAGDDYRLKQGTNPCRDAGTTVSTRPAPVGAPDVGAYEQGKLESAVVVNKFIEVTSNIMAAPLQPASGATGLTIACVGCTGTPVVSQAILKAGAAAVLQLSISGISSPGTCSLSLGSTNLTDSGIIGAPTSALAQGLNSVIGLSVSGTCENTVAGGGAPTPTHSRFPLDEGSGTVATDNTGNGNHGTVSSGVTWVSSSSGTGVTFPADATYRQITTTFGAGIDPTTQPFAQCIDVEPDLSAVPSIMISAGSNGTNQRAYVGITSVNGQPQWGIGVQSSGFTTGSEFVAAAQRATVCVTFDSVTDTATLWVNGVKGVQSGKSVKTYTSYGLVGNLRVGNDGTFTTNNGGFTVYGVWTWNTLPSDADLIAIYDAEFPSGTPLACHEQKTHTWELTRTDANGTPIATGTTGGSVDVVDGGGVALVIQVDCTTVAGAPLALRFYYSSDGVAYDFEIPTSLGAGGIALWGTDVSSGLNDGNATCCITGALTPVTGPTITRINSTPIINLAQNQSWTVRVLLRFATGLVGQSRYILLKQDNGLDLANGYTVGGARVNIISNRAGTGF